MSIRRSLGWIAGAQGAYFLLQFVTSVIVARLLSPYDVGIFSIAFAAVSLMNILQSLGLNNFLIREPELTPDVSATAFSVNLGAAVLMSLAIIGCSLAGGLLFSEPAVSRVLLWLSVVPLLTAIGFLPLALLERDGAFRSVSLVKTLSTLSGTAATLIFAMTGHSYMSFAYGQIIASCVSSVAAVALAPHHTQFRIRFERWREMQRFSLNVLATTGVSRVASRLQDLTLGRVLGLTALGLYSRSGNIFSILWDSIFLVICRVVFVDFAAGARSGAPLGPRYQYALQLLTAIMWPAFAGLGVLSRPFVLFIYGPNWASVATPLSLFCLVGILYTAIAMNWDLFIIAGETGRQARFEFVRSAVGVAFFAVGCVFSIEAAVAARVADAAFACALYSPHILRITGSRSRDLLRIYVSSAMLTLVAIAPAAVLMTIYRQSPSVPIVAVGTAIVLGIFGWTSMLWLTKHPLFGEARSVVTRRRRLVDQGQAHR